MNPVLRKEIRLLLPAWVAAVAAAMIPVWLWGAEDVVTENVSLVFFAAGALLLALSSFGLEMSLGTFSSLLAQPRPRVRIWQVKIGLLALALASVVVAGGYSWFCWQLQVPSFPHIGTKGPLSSEHMSYLILLSVMAFVGGLWTTLLLRQIAAAFWFAVVVPWVFLGFAAPTVENIAVDWGDTFKLAFLAFFTLGYGTVGFCVARWLFIHAQDKQAQEATDRGAFSFLPAFPTPSQPLPALLVKELRLQQGSLLIAVVLLLLHLVAVAVSNNYPGSPYNGAILNHVWMMWILVPLIAGCSAIAEERRIRTLDGALCLPFSRPGQFAVKLLVVFGLGLFLGAVMPWVLEAMRLTGHDSPNLGGLVIAAIIAASIGCYASSLTGALLPAVGLSVGLFLAFFVAAASSFGRKIFGGDFYACWLAALFAAFCVLSYYNFKHIRIAWRQWVRNGVMFFVVMTISFGMIAIGGLCFYIWNFLFYRSISFAVASSLLVILVAVLIRGLRLRAKRLT